MSQALGSRGAILSVGVLECDSPVAEAEQIAAMYLDARSVGSGAGERPLRHPTISADEMLSIAPMRGKFLKPLRVDYDSRLRRHMLLVGLLSPIFENKYVDGN